MVAVDNSSNISASSDLLDYYIYDYDEAVQFTGDVLTEMIPVAIVYGCMFLLGVVGNSLVIVSIAKHARMQTVTNAFLASLASADLLLVLICIPVKFAKFFTFSWTFGEALCKGVHYIQNASVICSILTMTSMSVERYYAIVYPMRAKFRCNSRRARNVICLVWVASFVLAVPILFGQIHKSVGERYKAFWCVKKWPTKTYSIVYELMYAHVVFVMPLCVMVFTYINICQELWSMSAWRATLQTGRSYQMSTVSSERSLSPACPNPSCRRSRDCGEGSLCHQHRISLSVPPARRAVVQYDDKTKRRQVIRMLLIIIILFIICWGPTLIDNVLKAFHVIEELNRGPLKFMRVAFAIMAYSNSCVNPIIYAFMSKNFRKCFQQAICAPCPIARVVYGGANCRGYGNRKDTAVLVDEDCQLIEERNKNKPSMTGNTRVGTGFERDVDYQEGRLAVRYCNSRPSSMLDAAACSELSNDRQMYFPN